MTESTERQTTRAVSALPIATQLFDLLLIVVTLYLSISYFYEWWLPYQLGSAIVSLAFLLAGNYAGIYRADVSRSFTGTALKVFELWWLVILTALLAAYLFKVSDYFSRAAVLTWIVVTPCALVLFRVVLALAQRTGFLGLRPSVQHAVIVGSPARAWRLASLLKGRAGGALQFVGYYSPSYDPPIANDAEGHLNHLGSLSDLRERAMAGDYDVVCIAMEDGAGKSLGQVISDLAESPAKVLCIPDLLTFTLLDTRVMDIAGIPCVSVFEQPLDGFGRLVKRAEDLVLGSLILLIMALPMLIIAIGIKLSSPGPVFYRQRRFGLQGEEILVWKFRSMTVCDDVEDFSQARRDDPRVTPFGAFLRRSSLDELPQFFNVMAGSMSIVGPRPHPIALSQQYGYDVEGYRLRQSVKPGITGWAQVNGWRGETDTRYKMEQRVLHDLHYIRNWSLWFDIKIIAITLLRGFNHENAY
ncbi:MAG: undecaprenyl-phosphate glucose phosphotransferase [Pseudomonadota bacterium]